MHQRSFRDRVLCAYRERCSVCRLHHSNLLDAEHIVPDSEEQGEPIVSNVLSLCKIHHAAFDNFYFGIRPDYRIVVTPEIMAETDGPMLEHGLQAIENSRLIVPRQVKNRPDPERLRGRFDTFAESAGL
ncbi:MAG: HNH endonuclease [Planctomycetes bacterium]|nr:HNH endonuclease [Planctomycetota bacterium]